MSEKKGVIMFYDILEQLEDFNDKDFRDIINAIISYDKDNIMPDFNGEKKIAFKFIKSSLDRNNNDYKQKCEMQRKKIQNYWDNKKNTTEYNSIQKKTNDNLTDIDTDTETDKDKDKETDKNKERDIIIYLNEKSGKNYRLIESNLKFVRSRLKDYTFDEIKEVIDKKVSEWKGTTMEDYLRPETLFNPTKFESYRNQSNSLSTPHNKTTVDGSGFKVY